jgi:hypothetical protein
MKRLLERLGWEAEGLGEDLVAISRADLKNPPLKYQSQHKVGSQMVQANPSPQLEPHSFKLKYMYSRYSMHFKNE